MFTQSKMSALTALAIVGLIATAQPVAARMSESSNDSVSVTVRYADLNLNTEAGAKVMLRRIRSSAEDICGPAPSMIEKWSLGRAYSDCVTPIVDHAVAQIDSPLVTALNDGSRGSTETMVASAHP